MHFTHSQHSVSTDNSVEESVEEEDGTAEKLLHIQTDRLLRLKNKPKLTETDRPEYAQSLLWTVVLS